MKELCQQEEMDDILEAYHRRNQLTYSEQLEFLAQIGREKDITTYQYKKVELSIVLLNLNVHIYLPSFFQYFHTLTCKRPRSRS